MRARRAIAISAVMLVVFATAAQARDTVAEQKTKVAQSEAKIARLQQELSSLLSEMQTLNEDVAAASGQMGIARLRIDRLEKRATSAQASFNARAREAYKRAGWREAQFLLGLRSLPQVLSFGRFLSSSVQSDVDAYKELLAAKEALIAVQNDIDSQRRLMFEADNRLSELRQSISATIAREQQALSGERTLLQQLEEKRRAEERTRSSSKTDSGRIVSPQVEAKRRARQILLDQKLAALLAWYAPGSGPEPFMPEKLRATGIVTSGQTSWYGPGFDMRRASSGATYQQGQFTAASLVLPFGTLLKVTYGGRSVVVVITDRGPYVAGRVLDLSAGAAQAIGVSGVKTVRMEIVVGKEPAPPFP
jgi:rare lipoprotein A